MGFLLFEITNGNIIICYNINRQLENIMSIITNLKQNQLSKISRYRSTFLCCGYLPFYLAIYITQRSDDIKHMININTSKIQQIINGRGFIESRHPLHKLDLAPSDSFLFINFKTHLMRMCFDSD